MPRIPRQAPSIITTHHQSSVEYPDFQNGEHRLNGPSQVILVGVRVSGARYRRWTRISRQLDVLLLPTDGVDHEAAVIPEIRYLHVPDGQRIGQPRLRHQSAVGRLQMERILIPQDLWEQIT